MSVRVKDTDHGYRKLREYLKAASKGAGVTVGVHAQEGASQHGNAASRVVVDSAGRAHLDGKFISAAKHAELKEKAGGGAPASVLDVAIWNEFGIGVPERSFLRAWFDQANSQNRDRLRAAMKLVLKGQKTFPEALELLGLKFAGELQRAIASQSLGLTPNAPSTVKEKGSSTPLIDKGQLRQSITYKVGPNDPSG